MKNYIKNGLMAVSASLLLLAASGTVHAAITAGGATIHNIATLTFTGGTTSASIDVLVEAVAAAPTITVDIQNNIVNANGVTPLHTYTIVNASSGTDTISLTATNTGNVGIGAPLLMDLNATGGNATSVTLGGSVTSQPVIVDNVINIPAGSQTGFAVNDIVRVNGADYTVAAVTAGTPATGINSAAAAATEIPATLTLTPLLGSPIITAGTLAGFHVGEVQTFTLAVTANIPTVAGVDGTHTIDIGAVTTAVIQGAGVQPAVTTTTATAGTATVTTTVSSPNVQLLKEVRNVTNGDAFGAVANVVAQSGDTLEYRLTATVVVGASTANAIIIDEAPAFTTYVAGSTLMNGGIVNDSLVPAAGTLPLSATTLTNGGTGGLLINGLAANPGVINNGTPAVVTFQVTVD